MAREVFGNEGLQNVPILFLRNIEVQLAHEPLGGLHSREGISWVFLRVQRTPPPPALTRDLPRHQRPSCPNPSTNPRAFLIFSKEGALLA